MASSDPERKTPKIYLLPNLMTAGNLACGFWAIVKIFEGMRDPDGGTNPYYIAIASILGACLFDSLDGRIARIKGQESLFGREFDSIADIVSFGLAPALLVMDIVLRDFDARLGWTIAFIYLLCGGMRLARFNCLAAMNPGSSSKDFVGFPIPAAAGLIASLTVFIFWLNEGEREIGMWKYFLLVLMLVLSGLMLSECSYPSFKKLDWRAQGSLFWVFTAGLIVILAVLYWEVVPACLFMAYLTYGLIRPWISRSWRKEIESAGTDEGDVDVEAPVSDEMEEDVSSEPGEAKPIPQG